MIWKLRIEMQQENFYNLSRFLDLVLSLFLLIDTTQFIAVNKKIVALTTIPQEDIDESNKTFKAAKIITPTEESSNKYNVRFIIILLIL